MISISNILAKNKSSINMKIQKPKKYAVFVHNDDSTPMDFVIHILSCHFYKDHDEAMLIMLQSHHNSKALVGVYSKELAEQKIYETMLLAKSSKFSFLITLEEYFA